ncbi:MAG: hypothetical protein ACI8X5_000615 [Planctomycetota bacterium]|jgi:uncharacterized protein YndB with AHSA1/START domain
MTSTSPATILQYEFELTIKAPTAKVWQALTEETNAWWLPDFHMVAAGSTVTLDARAGGPLVEQMENGCSLLCYTVTMCVPESSLHLVGHMAPQWGGPATTMLELALSECDAGTKFIVRDAIYGNAKEKVASSLESGWRQLFGQGLGAHVEEN